MIVLLFLLQDQADINKAIDRGVKYLKSVELKTAWTPPNPTYS